MNPMKTPHLLIVDDAHENIRILASVLSPQGYTITFALDGETALQLAGKEKIDLVLLDVMMPRLDGFSVCRKLKENPQTRNIPVIFITARADAASVIQGFESGGVDYITKPFSWGELLVRVKTHLHLKQTEDELRLMAKIFDTASEGIFLSDAEHRIITANPAFFHITGYAEHDLAQLRIPCLASGPNAEELLQQIYAELQLHGNWEGEIWQRRKDGESFPAWMTISAMRGDYSDVTQYVHIFNDMTRNKQNQLRMEHLATHDFLTDLPNRALFQDRLCQAILTARRTTRHFALLFIDLDRFKYINDTLGHRIGDAVLVETARRLQNCLRDSDTVARLGGDEFTVLLPNVNALADAHEVAEKILVQLSNPYELEKEKIYISSSIGISLFPNHGNTWQELLNHADEAMYHVKETGRNGVGVYCPAE